MTHLLVITNAQAGSTDAPAVDAALAVLRAQHTVDVAETGSPSDLDGALAEHPDVEGVVVFGGDGSLHAVVAALHRTDRLADVTVGLVPLGTGNDFAATLGLPDDPAEAAGRVGGRVRTLDLGTTTDGVMVNAVHIGVGADAAAAAQPFKRRLGPLGYVLGALVAGFTTPGARVEIVVDGRRLSTGDRIILVGAGNGHRVGGGTPLLPDADPSDGLLDIAILAAASRLRRIVYAWHVRGGKHPARDDVTYLRGREIVVRGDAMAATTDGELGEPMTEHRWGIEPAAWRMWA